MWTQRRSPSGFWRRQWIKHPRISQQEQGSYTRISALGGMELCPPALGPRELFEVEKKKGSLGDFKLIKMRDSEMSQNVLFLNCLKAGMHCSERLLWTSKLKKRDLVGTQPFYEIGTFGSQNRDPTHCSQKGPYFRDRVPIGTFLTFWVPIYISGSLYSVLWLNSRKECQFSLHVCNNE